MIAGKRIVIWAGVALVLCFGVCRNGIVHAQAAGSTGQVQINNGGIFGTDPYFAVNFTTHQVAVGALVSNGTTDLMMYNPYRNTSATSSITARFSDYIRTGNIPGTSSYSYGQLQHFYNWTTYTDTTPGCWGYAATCYDTPHQVYTTNAYVNAGGGADIYTPALNHYAVGDTIGFEEYVNSFGGSVDGGCPEGTKAFGAFVAEPENTWTGSVASGHGGAGQTTIYATCSTDCGNGHFGIPESADDPNVGAPASLGQGLWVMDEQSALVSGQIESTTSASGNVPGTMTVNITSGLSNLAVSTCEATLAATLSPTTNPSGSGSQPLTFTVNVVSGTCASGGLLSFSGTNHEQAIISSVTAPSGGQQTITANVRLVHGSGSYIYENANSDAGLFGDIVANNASNSVQFPFEVVGVQSVSGNTAVLWYCQWFSGSCTSGIGTGFPAGKMNLSSITTTALSNTAGTVTGSWSYNGNSPQYWMNATTLYISNASNSAFDGPCTNSARTTNGTFTCTQAASTGDTATTSTVTVTDSTNDNPYGNSRVNFYQGAAVVDPQDYNNPIVVNNVTNYPVDGNYLQVEPNEMPLTASDLLVEGHSSAQFHISDLQNNILNPVNYTSNGIGITMSGIGTNGEGSYLNNTAIGINNTTPNSQYSYFGGELGALPVMAVEGMWGNFAYFSQPPAIGSSMFLVNGCPVSPSSCNDPNYNYYLYNFVAGVGAGYNAAQFFPASDTMVWTGMQEFNSSGNDTILSFCNTYGMPCVNGSGVKQSIGLIPGGRGAGNTNQVFPLWNGTVTGGLAYGCNGSGSSSNEFGLCDSGVGYATGALNFDTSSTNIGYAPGLSDYFTNAVAGDTVIRNTLAGGAILLGANNNVNGAATLALYENNVCIGSRTCTNPFSTPSIAVNGGHNFTRHTIVTGSITPSSVAADTCAAQTATVTGLNAGDHVINRDVLPSFTAGLSLDGIIVTAANTASMNWCNNTASAITPPSGTYTFDVEQ